MICILDLMRFPPGAWLRLSQDPVHLFHIMLASCIFQFGSLIFPALQAIFLDSGLLYVVETAVSNQISMQVSHARFSNDTECCIGNPHFLGFLRAAPRESTVEYSMATFRESQLSLSSSDRIQYLFKIKQVSDDEIRWSLK